MYRDRDPYRTVTTPNHNKTVLSQVDLFSFITDLAIEWWRQSRKFCFHGFLDISKASRFQHFPQWAGYRYFSSFNFVLIGSFLVSDVRKQGSAERGFSIFQENLRGKVNIYHDRRCYFLPLKGVLFKHIICIGFQPPSLGR